jgi:hypothetical protein
MCLDISEIIERIVARKAFPDRVVILASVVCRPPVKHTFGRTGSICDGIHQRYLPDMVLGMWIGTCFQKILNNVEIGHVEPLTCIFAMVFCRVGSIQRWRWCCVQCADLFG